jgi:hypothetical protein
LGLAGLSGPQTPAWMAWIPKAGTLVTYSGTITQTGQTIEAQTESIADPVNNPEAFQTAGLNQTASEPK